MKKIFAAIAVLGTFAASAHAQSVGITAEIGTSGAGLHLVAPLIKETLNARLGFNGLNYSSDWDTEDATYDAKLKLRTFDALLDLYPTSTQFRLTGGLVYNGNKVSATAKPVAGNTYTFNGRTYSASDAGQVDGNIDFNKVAPYVGIGWGNAVGKNKGWGFTADVGVMFQGSPDVNLKASGCDPTICSQLASDLERESQDLRDKAKDYRYYPVVRVGLTYKF
ncbi:hypothetical protein [Noviherbaspirillum massiliense]|uniref:hypothetical protein n=1 Tax=Noviherbaspirillum massiliense TaxID=1465823 RepID=UPI0002D6AE30|nr:hypothetical protein [Noviherbaspirillum massiliense]